MAKTETIESTAKEYKTGRTQNIADLGVINKLSEVKTFEGTTTEGEEFSFKYIEVDGEKYKVPNSVLAQLKILIAENPDVLEFKVKKSGSGLNTIYAVSV